MRTLGSFTRPLLTSILGPVCIALPALNPQPCTCFAQGNLTPPGAPAPMMKSLDQLEPRTDVLKLSGDGTNIHIISQPGSYYLTTNVLGSGPSQNGILIATNHVTLNLNGFSVLATGPNFSEGISIAGSCTNLVVRHGMVSGWEAGDVVSASASSEFRCLFLRLPTTSSSGTSSAAMAQTITSLPAIKSSVRSSPRLEPSPI
jgi:hypothetical protein